MAWFRCGGGKRLKTVEVPASYSYGEGPAVYKSFDLSQYGNVVGIIAIKGIRQANAYYLSGFTLRNNILNMSWNQHTENTGSSFGHSGLTILVEE